MPGASGQCGLTVLIAEDDIDTLKLMSDLVSLEGHRAITARDGSEAVRLWESWRPDVIFMDMQMPGMDGIQATETIRNRERENEGRVPIYALTILRPEEEIGRCLAAGVTGHIPKPVDFHLVQQILRAASDPLYE